MTSSPRSFYLSSLPENSTVNIVLSEWYRTALTSENAYTRENSSSQDFMNYIHWGVPLWRAEWKSGLKWDRVKTTAKGARHGRFSCARFEEYSLGH